MPFSLDTDPICVDDIDFGLWYMDMQDHPDRYRGKRVQIKGMVIRSREDGAHYFVPGRKAMTCCADDIRFLGYLCRSDQAPKLTEGEWVRVTGTVKEEYNSVYQGRGPVIWAQEIEKADPPEEELVFFS